MRRLIFTNNTKLNDNKYTSGSGVGVVSSSNRAALRRLASKSSCCTYINKADVIKIKTPVKYIKVFIPNMQTTDFIQMSQLAVYSNGNNIAPAGTASAKNSFQFGSPPPYPARANDGVLEVRNFPLMYISQTGQTDSYWLLELESLVFVDKIVYYNRGEDTNERAIGMLINTYATIPSLDNLTGVPVDSFTCNADLIQTFNL